MENEQTPALPASYDLPTDVESMGPDDAAKTLNKILSDVGANKKHPYCNIAHPQHKEFFETITRLYEIKNPAPSGYTEYSEELSNPIGPNQYQLMSEALENAEDKNEAVQEKLRAGITAEIKQINEKWGDDGVNESEAAEAIRNPTKEKLEGFSQMKMLANGDINNLKPSIINDFQKLGMPTEQIAAVRHFFDVFVPGDPLSHDLANLIIKHNFKGKKFLKERTPRPFGEPVVEIGFGEPNDDYDRIG